MKKFTTAFILLFLFISDYSSADFIPEIKSLKQITALEKKTDFNMSTSKSGGASGGFNLGMAIIESEVGFAIGAFAELDAGGIAFQPQANYWKAGDQNNFEIAGLIRKYLGKKDLIPYIDGGLGVNFYNSDESDFTKLSIIIGGGIELTEISPSFSLLFDGKYKLIVNDPGNISCFIFTAGMKFPFK